ncbi:MAG: hypothetical protein ACKVPY_04890 [Paracoccaceae bacterium]
MRRARAPGLARAGPAALVALATSVGIAVAAPLTVRTGEHGGFTRLVMEPPAGTAWQVGRTVGGYELRLEAPDVTFNTARVFDLIPATRISGIGPGTVPSSLAVTLGCDCHVKAFESGRALVLDVADGPAPPDSPFETPFGSAAEAEAPAPLLLPLTEPEGPASPDPWIDTYWALSPTLTMGPRLAGPRRLAPRTDGEPDPPSVASSAGSGPTHDADATERSGRGKARQGPAAEPASGADPDAPFAANSLPAGEIGFAESELAKQFARAASQGLLTPKQAKADHGQEPGQGGTRPDDEADGAPVSATGSGGIVAGLLPHGGHLAIRAETSVDRDTLMSIPSKHTQSGGICPPDELFDVATWAGEGPPANEIGTARASLSGEFDMPNSGKTVALARLYIALSFGAEARQVLDAFAIADTEAPYLRGLSAILEGESPPPGLADLTGCGGKTALWVALATPPGAASRFDGRAAARHLSSLPPHLRRLLGPPLAERLLAAGDLQLAESVVEAIRRLPKPHGAAFDLVSARIDLERRRIEPALADLAQAIGTNDPEAPEAVAVAIETALAHGKPVDPAVIDTAAALAFELRGSATGLRLASAHTLAIAAGGDLAAAFAALDQHRADAPEADFRPALGDLAGRLATFADDGAFAALYFRRRADIAASEAGLPERRALSLRLARLGFSDEVASLLGDDGRADRAGRLILAEATLRDLRPEAALAALQGLDGPDAADLRDRANALLDPPGAGSGPTAPADPAARPADAPAPSGSLAEGRRLLDESRVARERILGALGGSAAPPAGG